MIPVRLVRSEARNLALFELRVDCLQVRLGVPGRGELVDTDDDPLVVVDRLGVLVGRRLDLILLVAGLDGSNRPAHLVDLVDVLPGEALDLVGERLHEVRAGERIGRVGDAALVADDLLGAQGDLC